MKLLVLLISLMSFTTFAVETGPTPDSAEKEKIENIRTSGGALKIEKTPEHVEGITPPPQEKTKKVKKRKKTKEVEEKK